MFGFMERTATRAPERGASLVEMSFLVPFLLVMIILSIDLGLMLNRYITLSRVAYEASRYAARTPGYHEMVPDGQTTFNLSTEEGLTDRVDDLLEGYEISETVTLIAEFDSSVNRVNVSLGTSVDFRFPIVKYVTGYGDSLPMTVRVSGPYLYPATS